MASRLQTAVPEPALIDLRDYFRVLREYKGRIVLVTLAFLALAVAYSLVAPKSYTSTAVVSVKPVGISLTSTSNSDPTKALSMTTEQSIANSTAVATIAKGLLHSPGTPQSLLKRENVNVPTDSTVLQIQYHGSSPTEAQQGANAFATAYLTYKHDQALVGVTAQAKPLQTQLAATGADLEKQLAIIRAKTGAPVQAAIQQKGADNARITGLQSQLDALKTINTNPGNVIVSATGPQGPSSPKLKLNLALGLFLGLVVGVGYAFLKDRLDDRLRGRADLEDALDLPVLALIPRVEGWTDRSAEWLATVQDPLSPAAEAYRTLRTSILVAAARNDVKTIVVVSAAPGEGKTTTAANLAVVLARTGKRVVLVSADMRKPRLHRFFALSNEKGLRDILARKTPAWEGLQESGVGNLWIFVSGEASQDAADLLQSDRMMDFLTERREVVDFLIMDCPPLLPVADGLELAARADAVLMVADATSTTRDDLAEARTQLERVGARVIGAVLNNAEVSSRYGYVQAETNGSEASRASQGRSWKVARRQDEAPT